MKYTHKYYRLNIYDLINVVDANINPTEYELMQSINLLLNGMPITVPIINFSTKSIVNEFHHLANICYLLTCETNIGFCCLTNSVTLINGNCKIKKFNKILKTTDFIKQTKNLDDTELENLESILTTLRQYEFWICVFAEPTTYINIDKLICK